MCVADREKSLLTGRVRNSGRLAGSGFAVSLKMSLGPLQESNWQQSARRKPRTRRLDDRGQQVSGWREKRREKKERKKRVGVRTGLISTARTNKMSFPRAELKVRLQSRLKRGPRPHPGSASRVSGG